MKKLEQQLIKISNKGVIESVTTYSTYYHIDNNLIIRVSDHLSERKNFDLQIINPLNGGTKYMVFTPTSKTSYLWTSKEIINYISFLRVQKRFDVPNLKEENTTLIKSEPDGLVISTPLLKVKQNGLGTNEKILCCHGSSEIWNAYDIEELPNLLKKHLNQEITLNDDFKLFLMTTPCTYKVVLNMYYNIIIINEREPTLELLNYFYIRLK